MVSAETALTIPALVAVLVLCLAGVQAGVDKVRCTQAAGVAVRALVRGDAPNAVRSLAERTAPEGAQVVWSVSGSRVAVEVHSRPRVLAAVGIGLEVGARTVGQLESADP